MRCDELISFLDDYLDGGLAVETVIAFEAHLIGCRSCRAYLASYRETIVIARDAMRAPMLDVSEAPEELIAAILAATR
jgi:anti-sigma factor RsiW